MHQPLTEHERFVELFNLNKVEIGVEPALARKVFTDTPASWPWQNFGESILLERVLVKACLYLDGVALLASAVACVLALRWWAAAAIPVCVLASVWHGGTVSVGKQRIWFVLMAVIGAAWFAVSERNSASLWLLLFLSSLLFARLKYYASTFFIRALVIRNSRAYRLLLREGIIAIRDT